MGVPLPTRTSYPVGIAPFGEFQASVTPPLPGVTRTFVGGAVGGGGPVGSVVVSLGSVVGSVVDSVVDSVGVAVIDASALSPIALTARTRKV